MDGPDKRAVFEGVFRLEVVIAAVVFVAVLGVLTFAIVRSFTRWGRTASRSTSHPRLESAYLSLLIGMAAFLVVNSLSANSSGPVRPAMKVSITASQWCWRFGYTGTKVVVGNECFNGHYPTLELPTGTVIQFTLTSLDVVHAFWVPYLRFKMQAFPHYVNTFVLSVPHAGTYPGRCAEYCGIYHYDMDFYVKAVSPHAFASWLHTQEAR